MGQTHDLVFDRDHVVKRYTSWDRGEHEREWRILRTFGAELADVLPQPFQADLRATPPWISMSRLPGLPLSGCLSNAKLYGLEQALRRMWSIPVDGLSPRRFHPDEARSFIAQGLTSARRPTGVAGEAYDVCVSHMATSVPWLGHPILGHGDGNLANYLWDGSGVRIVDFEDAGASHVEYELGFLIEHLSSRATNWQPLLDRFTTDAARLRWARLTSAAHWLLMLLPGGPATRHNQPEALDLQARRILVLA